MSSRNESPASQSLEDITKKEQLDEIFDKHQRFNFRKLNLPPLNKDHQRAQESQPKDLSHQIRNSQAPGSTAVQFRNKQVHPEQSEEPLSPAESYKSQSQRDHEASQRDAQSHTPTNQSQNNAQDMSSSAAKEINTPKHLNSGTTANNLQLSSIDQRRARRKQLNLRENLSPQQLQMNSDYLNGHGADFDHRTTGRWSREEHEKFIEEIISQYHFNIYLTPIPLAMSIYGRDWKRVEAHIGTRSGAQIRSHAQKFFNRIEKELGADVETYIEQKAKAIFERKSKLQSGILGITGLSALNEIEHSDNDHIDDNNEISHPPVLVSPRKSTNMIEMKPPIFTRDRSISHTFGVADLLAQNNTNNEQPKNEMSSAGSKTSINKSQSRGGPQQQNLQYEPSKFSLKQSRQKKNKERQIYAFSPQITAVKKTNEAELNNNILQQVIKESFNNYQNPQENSPEINIKESSNPEEFFTNFDKERCLIYNQILLEFNDNVSSPIKLQIYLELLQSLYNKLVQTYTKELERDTSMTSQIRQRYLALILEFTNNISLVQQIQSFQALSATIDNKIQQNIQQTASQPRHSFNEFNLQAYLSNKQPTTSGGTLTPQSINNQILNNIVGLTQNYNNNNLNNLAIELLQLLQNNQRTSTSLNSRKISNDWMDRSHSYEPANNNELSLNTIGQHIINSFNQNDEAKKRIIKADEKHQDNLRKTQILNQSANNSFSNANINAANNQNNQSSFLSQIGAALGASNNQGFNQVNNSNANKQSLIGSFKPSGDNDFALQSIKRLRGLSNNLEPEKISPERIQVQQPLLNNVSNSILNSSNFLSAATNNQISSNNINNEMQSTIQSLMQYLGSHHNTNGNMNLGSLVPPNNNLATLQNLNSLFGQDAKKNENQSNY